MLQKDLHECPLTLSCHLQAHWQADARKPGHQHYMGLDARNTEFDAVHPVHPPSLISALLFTISKVK